MKLACVFTGQGSQFPRMGETLQSFPGFDDQVHAYQKSSALPLKEWLFEAPEESVARTEIAQPLIYFYAWVAYQAFMDSFDPRGWLYAGHSLGEYTALVAAGVLHPEKTLGTVHLRGKYMQDVCPQGFGGMAAVMMRSVDDVVRACEEISHTLQEPGVLSPANFNSDRQVVVSGRLDAIARLEQSYQDYDLTKVIRLKVSAPFHSRYMSPMKETFSQDCQSAIEFSSQRDNEGWYVPNVTAEPLKISTLTPQHVLHLLLEQLDHPVRWDVTSKHIGKDTRIDAVVEFGPKPVLSSMMKSIVACPIHFVGSAQDLEKVKGELS